MSFLEQIKALEENRNEETSNIKTIRLYEETKSILARKYDACVLFNEDRKYIDYENICLSNNIDLGLLNELCKKDDIELSFDFFVDDGRGLFRLYFKYDLDYLKDNSESNFKNSLLHNLPVESDYDSQLIRINTMSLFESISKELIDEVKSSYFTGIANCKKTVRNVNYSLLKYLCDEAGITYMLGDEDTIVFCFKVNTIKDYININNEKELTMTLY